MPKATVLIVDDSPLIRQVVADAFTPSGYQVLMAADGSEALRKICERHPDLIVADILMPVMDGWRLCEEVRRVPETAQIPFIFLTTEQEAQKRVRGLRMGADDYLTKPFSREELLARAENILERARKLKDAEATGDMLSGHTRHLSMADLLQILSLNGRTGALRLEGPAGEEGRIYFREGRIIHARLGPVEGEKALFRLMMWPESRFTLEDLPRDVPESILATTSSVLMEGFTHWDELRHLEDQIPPSLALFRVRPPVSSFIDHIELSNAERDVIQGVERRMTVAELLDALPHRDLETYRALLGLLDKGFVESIEEEEEEEVDTQPFPRPNGGP